MWYADRETQPRCGRVTSPVNTRTHPQPYRRVFCISNWLFSGTGLIFTWSWLVDRSRKWLLACVTDSHSPHPAGGCSGGDDSSTMAVWDYPIWRQWHHFSLIWEERAKKGALPNEPWGFWWELVRCGVDVGVATAKSQWKSWGGMSGHQCVRQQMSAELMRGLFVALQSEHKPELNWPVFHLHSETDDSPTPVSQEKHTVVWPAD